MDKHLVRLSLERWKAMEAVEHEESINATIDLRWKQLNSIYLLARGLGIEPADDQDTERVRERWRKIKTTA